MDAVQRRTQKPAPTMDKLIKAAFGAEFPAVILNCIDS